MGGIRVGAQAQANSTIGARVDADESTLVINSAISNALLLLQTKTAQSSLVHPPYSERFSQQRPQSWINFEACLRFDSHRSHHFHLML
jgi:hypothetical protein